MIERAMLPFMVLNPRFFEDFTHYQPSKEFLSVAERICSSGWSYSEGGFWTSFHPSGVEDLTCGWKIHLSAHAQNSDSVLKTVLPTLACRRVAFKFLADRRVVHWATGKWWPRTSSGKFITIYPTSVLQCQLLLDELALLTSDFVGPFILTDRSYKNSKVVFYRYGAHRGDYSLDYRGYRRYHYIDAASNIVPDARPPYFVLPLGVNDPFATPQGASRNPLLDSYEISSASKFSSAGGIYKGIQNTSGAKVIIREARPHLGPTGEHSDAVTVLKREARILQKLQRTGVVPHLLDVVEDHGHYYLCVEEIDAENLWGTSMEIVFAERQTSQEMFERFRSLFLKLIGAVRLVHDCGVVIRDLSRMNVLIKRKDSEVFLVDFEFAYDLKLMEDPYPGWTAGYASPQQIAGLTPTFADDCYALGALLVDSITLCGPGLALNQNGVLAHFEQILNDFGLPSELLGLVRGLLASTPEERLDLDTAEECLREMSANASITPVWKPWRTKAIDCNVDVQELTVKCSQTAESVAEDLLAGCAVDRQDSLWPISHVGLASNAASFEYGASGIVWVLHQLDRVIPRRVVPWILDKATTRDCTAGLFIGLGGIALALHDSSFRDEGRLVMTRASSAAELLTTPGLYNGLAGWGTANLAFWKQTGDAIFLNNALGVARQLILSGENIDGGLAWTTEGHHVVGLGFGSSGVALFFTYLYSATLDQQFRNVAEKALRFDLAQSTEQGPGLLFPSLRNQRSGMPKSPHARFGTAGVGSVAIRMYRAFRDPALLLTAQECAASLLSRYTNKLWDDYGLSGMGHFLLDMYNATGEASYLSRAYYYSELLLLHRIPTESGCTFLGAEMVRVSNDVGEGSAGIAHFLNRLSRPALPRSILPDYILPE